MGKVSNELLIRLAFDSGDPEAMFRLAFKYKLGLDLRQDLKKARRLLLMAGKSGHDLAMWMLAICYNSGKWDFPVDRRLSGFWYLQLFKKWSKDAAQGDETARILLESFHEGQRNEHGKSSTEPTLHRE